MPLFRPYAPFEGVCESCGAEIHGWGKCFKCLLPPGMEVCSMKDALPERETRHGEPKRYLCMNSVGTLHFAHYEFHGWVFIRPSQEPRR